MEAPAVDKIIEFKPPTKPTAEQELSVVILVTDADAERFKPGHLKDLCRRHLFFTKEVDGQLMIVVDGDAKYIRKFMIEISGLNSHMIDPPSEYEREVTVLLPNTDRLRAKFDSKKEAPITLL